MRPALLSLLLGLVAPQAPPTVVLKGVCTYADGPVSCWTPNGVLGGAPDPALAARMDRALRGSVSRDLPLRYGRKNRLLVTTDLPTYASRWGGPGREADLTIEGIVLLESSNERGYLVSAPAGATTGRLGMEIYDEGALRAHRASLDLRPEAGASAETDGFAFRVRSVASAPTPLTQGAYGEWSPHPGAVLPGARKVWKIVLDAAPPEGTRGEFLAEAILRDGGTVVRVDAEGRPRPDGPDGSAMFPGGAFGKPPVFGIDAAPHAPGEIVLTSAFDPRLLAGVRLSVVRLTDVAFEDIPLDPRK